MNSSLLTTPNLIGLAVLALATWLTFLRKGQAAPAAAATLEAAARPAVYAMPLAPPSLSRLISEYEHDHADQVLRQKLGSGRAADIGSKLGGPPPGPAPTTAPAAGSPGPGA